MELKKYRFDEISVNFDKKRRPLSGEQREKRKGKYRYYGAQGIIDHIDDYIFDGTYLLIAEDGENLKSKKQNIAQIVEGKFWVNNHAHIVQGNRFCDIRYLCYLLNSTDLSGYITGSAQPKLSQSSLNAIMLLLPEINMQQKIAEYLYVFDEKIALNQQINARIMKLLEQAIEQDGVYNIFAEAGKKNPEISILSEEYMEKIRRMKHKNIAAEMLRKLLEDNIRVFARTGVVKSQLFSEKMQKLLKMYNNRLITSAEVIEELLNLSKEMTEAYKAGDEKGLTTEELAFYDALVADPEVLRKMQDKVLIEMAQELTELIRRSRTVDWDKKESARAYMRTQVKHLLRKYKYPPEKARGAVDIVIKQAELMSSNIKPRAAVYDFQPETELSMVAEESVPYGEKPKQ